MSTFDPLCLAVLPDRDTPIIDRSKAGTGSGRAQLFAQRGLGHSVPPAVEPILHAGVAAAAMAYVEPQHNAATPDSVARGVRMTDERKEADLPTGGPQFGPVSDHMQKADTSDDDTGMIANRSNSVADQGVRKANGNNHLRGSLSAQSRNRIAVQLRAMYDAVAQQPVPDRFAELIAKLDDSGRNNNKP